MKLKAIIFDVDGTLADTEKDGHRVAFNIAFKEAGLDWEWDDKLYGDLLIVTGGKERMKFYIDEYFPSFDIGSFDSEKEFIANLHKEKTKHYVKLMNENKIPLRVGVKRLIQEARDKNITLAISTTTSYDNVTALLTKTLGEESIKWFSCIGAGDVVEHKKPASDIYTWVLDELKLKANECVAIEDSHNGVISATTIGLPTLATIIEYTKNHDLSKADMIVDSLGDDGVSVSVTKGDALLSGIVDVAALENLIS